jgi:hypothetical protein
MPTAKTWNMLAAATFGVGDIVLTKTGVDKYGTQAEGNPAAKQIMEQTSTTGWAVNASVFKGLILLSTLSWGEYLDGGHPFLARSPAIILTVLGAWLTGGWLARFITEAATDSSPAKYELVQTERGAQIQPA